MGGQGKHLADAVRDHVLTTFSKITGETVTTLEAR